MFLLTNIYSNDILIQKNSHYVKNHIFKDLQQLNKFNGDVTESVMSKYFKSSGWGQIEGEVGVNGIDGLFIKKNKDGNIKKVMFVESKFNKSQLGWINKKSPSLKARQMSKKALDKQIKKLIKDINKKLSNSSNERDIKKFKKQLKDYKSIQSHIKHNAYKSRLFKIKPIGNDKFKITIDALEQNGYKNITKQSLKGKNIYKAHNLIINLKEKYPVNSYEAKIQNQLKSSIKEVKASRKIKRAYNNSSKTAKLVNGSVPTIYKKKGNKILAFVSAKKLSQFKKLEFMKKVKGGDVVMISIESGIAVYSILHGGITYSKASKLLIDSSKSIASKGFSSGIAFLTPPPATFVVITSLAATIAFDYTIDKYVELDKRNYVGLEDMLWDVPEEVKNKITIFNLEDIKRTTIFDFDDINKDTILDDEVDGESIFEEDSNKETIFDYEE